MKPLDRSGVIRESISVLVFGVTGLLPLIGIFPAVSAIIRGIRIRRAYAGPNPVENYRKWGMALGSFCLLLNVCAVAIAIYNILDQANQGSFISYGMDE